jgi:hypothetical protein
MPNHHSADRNTCCIISPDTPIASHQPSSPFGLLHQQLHLLKPFFRTLFGGRSFQNP